MVRVSKVRVWVRVRVRVRVSVGHLGLSSVDWRAGTG